MKFKNIQWDTRGKVKRGKYECLFFELLARLSFYFVKNNYVLMSVYITGDDNFRDEDVCLSTFEDYISSDRFCRSFINK